MVECRRKVALITLHHVRNYGSCLQTYASQCLLQHFGMDVEIVDFIPRGLTLKCGIATIRKNKNFIINIFRKLFALINFSIVQFQMILFLKKEIHLTDHTYHDYNDIAENPPEADIYICGSDQIWNTQNANLRDDLRAYYLDFGKKQIPRLAFSSSIGKESFSKEESDFVRRQLSHFSAISVRERNAKDLLENLGLQNVHHILDPTLLLPKERWMEFADKKIKDQNYILVYNLNRNPSIKRYARTLSEKLNMRIINISSNFDYLKGAKNCFSFNPRKFVAFVSNASFVITDSFHGTAFAINFLKPLMVFPAPKFNSRITSLLAQFELSNRFVEEEKYFDWGKEPERLPESMEKLLVDAKNSGLSFLNTALKEGCK